MKKKTILCSAIAVGLIITILIFNGLSMFLLHPKLLFSTMFNRTYIASVESVVSTIDNSDPNALGGERIVYDPPVSGSNFTVVCRLNLGISEAQVSGMKLKIYQENNVIPIASFDRVAYDRCRIGFQGYIPPEVITEAKKGNVENEYVIFNGNLPNGLETGRYYFVILDNYNLVDTVFSYTIAATEKESDIKDAFIPEDVAKPVIYMYPETDTEVNVSLDLDGEFTCTYPSYNDDYGWHVMAHPGGVITDLEANREYDYLYWEGRGDVPDDFEHAVCVRGCDTATFLEEYLEASGLTYSEIDDFITYWLPKMECNEYNLISFPITEYEELAELHVNPEPDTVIRVYMVFTPLDEEVYIPEEQQLQMPTPVERTGFTVVEWGGSEI